MDLLSAALDVHGRAEKEAIHAHALERAIVLLRDTRQIRVDALQGLHVLLNAPHGCCTVLLQGLPRRMLVAPGRVGRVHAGSLRSLRRLGVPPLLGEEPAHHVLQHACCDPEVVAELLVHHAAVIPLGGILRLLLVLPYAGEDRPCLDHRAHRLVHYVAAVPPVLLCVQCTHQPGDLARQRLNRVRVVLNLSAVLDVVRVRILVGVHLLAPAAPRRRARPVAARAGPA
mmetsp:Transcript_82916/g.216420  ORF Transcript_82916/g.216420 Transcript_82916/m.216420 type:complete len:228 (+) Transcript_82916:295-978(+)